MTSAGGVPQTPEPWKLFTYEAPAAYGWHLWIGRHLRWSSTRDLTPMWPHVYKSADEFCNPVLAFHLWPIGGLDIWLRRNRTEADGRCDRCKAEWAAFDAERNAGSS